MGAPLFPTRSVEDAAIALIRAAEALDCDRAEADRLVSLLEERWAANRARACPDPEPRANQ